MNVAVAVAKTHPLFGSWTKKKGQFGSVLTKTDKQNTPKEDSFSAKTCPLDQTFEKGEAQ